MSVNKIEGGKGEAYPAPKVGLSSEIADDSMSMGEVGPVHGDKIVMRNNIQTYTGVGQVPIDIPEDQNTFEDIIGEDLQGETEGTGGPDKAPEKGSAIQ